VLSGRPYREVICALGADLSAELAYVVGRCRETVSKRVSKAPMISALETRTSQTAFNICFQSQLAPL